jgi:hypothetical protein
MTQTPTLHTVPVEQSRVSTQAEAQAPAMQAWVPVQSELRLHWAGRIWHAPDWQRCPAPQS